MNVDPHVNVEAIRMAVKGLEANPENWDQSHWTGVKLPTAPKAVSWTEVEHFGDPENRWIRLNPDSGAAGTHDWVQVEKCHTTYCLAGQAMLQAGMVNEGGWYVNEAGLRMDNWQVEQHAAGLLGLDENQAEDLFYWGVNHNVGGTLADFKAHITKVTGVRFEDE